MSSWTTAGAAPFSDCCSAIESCFKWCSSCGGQQSYAQAFLDERPEGRSASVTSSPYQSPAQATTSAGAPSAERTALIPKATELHSTGPLQGRQETRAGRPPKWVSEAEQAGPTTPTKEKKGELSAKGRNASGLSLAASEEGEFCSTCLEPYTKENPAIWTKCNHHFHLACIYEWMERKQTCPICEREMSFEEVLS